MFIAEQRIRSGHGLIISR